jgi:DNA invertase Pin-like site-specific DNA recombinase
MKAITYFRVSTPGQGRSGLGLEAQQASVAQFCMDRRCDVVQSFVEIESGKHDDRPELAKALHMARVTNSTLIVAKLDRLSRNVAFLAQLQDSGVRFVAADMPEANELTIHIMAAVAQAERKAISRRTSEALQARKARGLPLGNPNGAAALLRAQKGNGSAIAAVSAKADARARDLAPVVADIMGSDGVSYRRLALELNRRGIVTARNGCWHPASARALVTRLGRHAP